MQHDAATLQSPHLSPPQSRTSPSVQDFQELFLPVMSSTTALEHSPIDLGLHHVSPLPGQAEGDHCGRTSEDGYVTTAYPDDFLQGLPDLPFDPLKDLDPQAIFNLPEGNPLRNELSCPHPSKAPSKVSSPSSLADPAALLAALAPTGGASNTAVRTSTSSASPSSPSDLACPPQSQRKRRQASELISDDAPVQKRTYFGRTATSRRDYSCERDEVGETPSADTPSCDLPASPNSAMAALLARRHKNTISARQSRRRKAEELSQLKVENKRLVSATENMADELANVRQELAATQARLALALASTSSLGRC